MAEIERVKIIPLTVALDDAAEKTTYTQLELKAPTLSQAEQFYEKQAASTSLAAPSSNRPKAQEGNRP